MNGKLLEKYFPQLAKIPFDSYEKDMSTVVHLLLTFEIHGTFTISMDDTIESIADKYNDASLTHSIFSQLFEKFILHFFCFLSYTA